MSLHEARPLYLENSFESQTKASVYDVLVDKFGEEPASLHLMLPPPGFSKDWHELSKVEALETEFLGLSSRLPVMPINVRIWRIPPAKQSSSKEPGTIVVSCHPAHASQQMPVILDGFYLRVNQDDSCRYDAEVVANQNSIGDNPAVEPFGEARSISALAQAVISRLRNGRGKHSHFLARLTKQHRLILPVPASSMTCSSSPPLASRTAHRSLLKLANVSRSRHSRLYFSLAPGPVGVCFLLRFSHIKRNWPVALQADIQPVMALSPRLAADVHQVNILYACDIVFLSLVLAAFCARVYSRAMISRKFGMDDWAMCVAVPAYVATCAIDLEQLRFDRALTNGVILGTVEKATQLVRLQNLFYAITVVMVKLSIGLFYLKIFTIYHATQRYIIYAMVALSTLSGIVWVVLIEASCGISPFGPTCSIQYAFDTYSITWSAINAFTDLVLTGVGVQALWGAQMKWFVKVSAMALLGLACIGGSLSVVRLVVNAGLFKDDPDVQQLMIIRWSIIESGIYIITASLATMRSLLQRCWSALQQQTGTWLSTRDTEATIEGQPTRTQSYIVGPISVLFGKKDSAKEPSTQQMTTFQVVSVQPENGAV
ncbi:hypothetical protein ANO11243_056950 [Dothideomycetidae sp. 11243]|nr:hypothetical protein ANO11243_056950 [fungal sp. No.11243]